MRLPLFIRVLIGRGYLPAVTNERKHVSNAVKRAVRTFIQTFLGVLLSSPLLGQVQAELAGGQAPDWHLLGNLAASGIAAGIVATLSWVQNALEDGDSIPMLLKNSGQ